MKELSRQAELVALGIKIYHSRNIHDIIPTIPEGSALHKGLANLSEDLDVMKTLDRIPNLPNFFEYQEYHDGPASETAPADLMGPGTYLLKFLYTVYLYLHTSERIPNLRKEGVCIKSYDRPTLWGFCRQRFRTRDLGEIELNVKGIHLAALVSVPADSMPIRVMYGVFYPEDVSAMIAQAIRSKDLKDMKAPYTCFAFGIRGKYLHFSHMKIPHEAVEHFADKDCSAYNHRLELFCSPEYDLEDPESRLEAAKNIAALFLLWEKSPTHDVAELPTPLVFDDL